MELKYAERIKELREERNLSQKQLSNELGGTISPSAIGLWELGKRIPNLEAAAILAKYFGVTIDYIAGIED